MGQTALCDLHREQPLLRCQDSAAVDQANPARGVVLPLYFGLAGPVDRTRLLNVATKIGVGESARFLSGHAGWFLRMGAPGGYNPSRLLGRLGTTLADPASLVEGVHVFTFNQLRATEQWRRSVVEPLGRTSHPA